MKISCYISFDEHFLWLYCAPRLLITSAPTSKIEFFASTFCSPLSTFASPPPPYATLSGNQISATKDLDAITTQNPDTRLIHQLSFDWEEMCGVSVRQIILDGPALKTKYDAFFQGILCIPPSPSLRVAKRGGIGPHCVASRTGWLFCQLQRHEHCTIP